MGKSENPKKHRIQFEFSDSDFDRLNRLCELSENRPKADVTREAYQISLWVYENVLKGGKVVLEMPDGLRLTLLTTTIMALQSLVERGDTDHLR